MKKLLFVVAVCFLLGACVQAPKQSAAPVREALTAIQWLTDTDYYYGNYSKRDTICCDYLYKNVGAIPFVIHDVTTACGCTSVSYDKEPTQPGDTGVIHLTYNGNGFLPGRFTKHIFIRSNAQDSVITLLFNGFFEEKEQNDLSE
ncbi:MAG: DUF1573 domain-containing protein [Prevotella sp.]|nr:DUF1573 domain-containing protein [Prevotella sp.]